jgi:hypothetical protein
LGNVNKTTLEIDLGLYRVRLFQDLAQEIKHTLIEHEIDYPPQDGSDWCLVLNRLPVNSHDSIREDA